MNSLYAVSAKNVDFSYGGRKVLSDLSLEVRAGERVCLSAASGAGKTTLLRLICGLEKPSAGEISVNGEVFCLFQEDRLIPNLSVAGNIRFIGATREQIISALDAVGLRDTAELMPGELSGGMRRRVAIARLCAAGCLREGNSGRILLLDEPFSGLDTDSKRISADAILRVSLTCRRTRCCSARRVALTRIFPDFRAFPTDKIVPDELIIGTKTGLKRRKRELSDR